MKKILVSILIVLLLAGCSANSTQKQSEKKAEGNSSSVEKQEQSLATYEPLKQQTTASQQTTEGKEWFAGSIGNVKIHAKLDISGKTVSGIYYYDQYKTNIVLKGSIEDEIIDLQTITLTEDTDKKGTMNGLFKTKDYIQGYWRSGKDIYPMYLIREGSEINPPKQPAKQTLRFDGHWTGKSSGYFAGSEADIKVLFDDLILYELSAHNGTHMGGLDCFAIVNSYKAKTVFKDTTYGERQENVTFEFSVENNNLNLKSNEYDFMCGMGVGFDSSYTKEKVDTSLPSAQQVGIVETKAQDELFKKIVGDEYDTFIQYTQSVNFSEVVLDGKKVNAGESLLRGMYGYCFYIVSPENIYAAIVTEDNIKYYTNDKNYADKLPQPILDWTKSKRDLNVEYYLKE